MNSKYALTIVLFSFLFSRSATGQHKHDETGEEQSKSENMVEMMGQPTFQQSVEGFNIRVWLMTSEDHKKLMKERMKGSAHDKEKMHHEMMGMNHEMKHMEHDMTNETGYPDQTATMDAMMAGTHHVMLVVTDESTEKPAENAEVEVQIASPSEKTCSQKLKEMMGHSCGGLTLEEKGEYGITAAIKVGVRSSSVKFKYQVQ